MSLKEEEKNRWKKEVGREKWDPGKVKKVVSHIGKWGMKLKGTGKQLRDQIRNVALYKSFSFSLFWWPSQTVRVTGLFLNCHWFIQGAWLWNTGIFHQQGKKTPASDCLETQNREGVNGCSVYSWELLVSRKQGRMHKPWDQLEPAGIPFILAKVSVVSNSDITAFCVTEECLNHFSLSIFSSLSLISVTDSDLQSKEKRQFTNPPSLLSSM